MSQFEFVLVLMSFVVAFAISEILAGWGRQFRQREQVTLSALQLTASALLLLALVQALWGYWNFRDTAWTLGRFLVAFLPLLVLSTAPFIITPHISDRGSVDAGAHYFRVRPVMFGILCVYVLLNLLAEWVLSGLTLHTGQALRPLGIAILLVLAWSGDPRIHWAGLAALLLLQTGFGLLVTPGLD